MRSGAGENSPRGAHRARHERPAGRVARRGAARLTQVVATLVSAGLLLGLGYGWFEYRSLDNGLQRMHLTNLAALPMAHPPAAGPAGGSATAPGARAVEGTDENILVVGIDSRAGLSPAERRLLYVGDAETMSTDTIMVIHVPADGRRASLISIPRDSYVDIPGGYLKNKINAAYADGYQYAAAGSTDSQRQAAGANVLIGAVSALTGLRINHYVQVGFGGFYTIARAIGGITVDLCAATDDTYAYNEAHGEGHVGSGFQMSAGVHHLTPVQTLEFVRQRHNLTGGDLGRDKRQRYFLRAAFDEISSAGVLLNPVKLGRLIDAVTGAFYIDDNDLSLADLAAQMTNLSAGNITGYTIPTTPNGTATVAGQQLSVDMVDPVRVRAFVADVVAGRPAGPTGKRSGGPATTTASAPGEPAGARASAGSSRSTSRGCVN